MILAGGSGSRLGADVPKQFLEIDGRTILEYSVEVFDEHPGIDVYDIFCCFTMRFALLSAGA